MSLLARSQVCPSSPRQGGVGVSVSEVVEIVEVAVLLISVSEIVIVAVD